MALWAQARADSVTRPGQKGREIRGSHPPVSQMAFVCNSRVIVVNPCTLYKYQFLAYRCFLHCALLYHEVLRSWPFEQQSKRHRKQQRPTSEHSRSDYTHLPVV